MSPKMKRASPKARPSKVGSELLAEPDLDLSSESVADPWIVTQLLPGLGRILVRDINDGRTDCPERQVHVVVEVEGDPVICLDAIVGRIEGISGAGFESRRSQCSNINSTVRVEVTVIVDAADEAQDNTRVMRAPRVVCVQLGAPFRGRKGDSGEVQIAQAVSARIERNAIENCRG